MLLLFRVILFKFADPKVNIQLTVNANDRAVKTQKNSSHFRRGFAKITGCLAIRERIPCFHRMILRMTIEKSP